MGPGCLRKSAVLGVDVQVKLWLQNVSFLLCVWALSGCLGCSRRTTSAAPPPSASALLAKAAPSASAAAPDPCPRLWKEETPWSQGGLIRSLGRDAILEPAVRAAAAAGLESYWDVSESVVAGKSEGIGVAVAPLHATGTGAALLALRQVDLGYCVTGVWFYSFGGAGVTFKLVAQTGGSHGDAALMTYAVTEGWNGGGPVAWLCKLATVRVDSRGLLKIHETPAADCPAKPGPVRFERKKDQILLREGHKSWPIDD